MISDAEVRLTEWILQKACREPKQCPECLHRKNCDDIDSCPAKWKVDDPPPEPTERPRIEWLRMLPDNEMLMAVDPDLECNNCKWKSADCSKNYKFTCNIGHMGWWNKVVTLEKFRKDVRLE